MTRNAERYFVETWGCQLNEHDSERLAGLLEIDGYEKTPTPDDANIILLNTCSVRDKAAQKFYTRLGRLKNLKKKRPDTMIVVCGCVAQHEKDQILTRAPYVDAVLGTRVINHLPEIIRRIKETKSSLVDTKRYDDSFSYAPETLKRESRIRAYVTVMEGCSKVCAFCIVPLTRGAEISRPFKDILNEIKYLADNGYKEVQLLGQNVTSYNSDGKNFASLLDAVSNVGDIARVRFITSYPSELTERIADLMKERKNICKAIHLPVQSGSDRILKKMKRFYTRKEYLEKIAMLREKMPEIAVSTDIIVGFPGETEEDFAESVSIVREAEFEWLYSFKYSKRKGTPAANYDEQIPAGVASERLERLHAEHRKIQEKKLKNYEGRTTEVLVDGVSKRNPRMMAGRTDTNFVVNFEGSSCMLGSVVPVHIERANPNSLFGRIAKE